MHDSFFATLCTLRARAHLLPNRFFYAFHRAFSALSLPEWVFAVVVGRPFCYLPGNSLCHACSSVYEKFSWKKISLLITEGRFQTGHKFICN
jgi:hypothetical protein